MPTASSRWPAAALASPLMGVAHTPGFCRENDPERLEVEGFIREVYARRYGAHVRHMAPVLAYLRDGAEIVAAAGYREAQDSPLFLERYLDAPVEVLLGSGSGVVPARASIVEVGHLAATRAGEGRRLIHMLGAHLAERGFEWVVSTLTQELRLLFLRIGVTPLTLGVANPNVLGDEAAQWGSYYQHSPLVLAGNLPQAMRRISTRHAGGAQ
ncbi:thermostable hemolysin [uncultured Hydrogenophaga sp.]|uniref:thermostable hemolysin n=1 Tax=uncultured Hydrogenophaga sp. TaxID=199683 RepID=UPI00265E9DE6|nr:thermostable hemolysin [uncultured Hydrogenophaga sp.]